MNQNQLREARLRLNYLQEKAVTVRNVNPDEIKSIEEPFISYLAELWQDSGIQSAYRRRFEFPLADSAKLYI